MARRGSQFGRAGVIEDSEESVEEIHNLVAEAVGEDVIEAKEENTEQAVAHVAALAAVDRTAAVYAAFGVEEFVTYAKCKAVESLFAGDIAKAQHWLNEAQKKLAE